MSSATLNGIDFYYEVAGTGPRVVFVNGSGATLADASPLVGLFANRFEVAAMDPRGLGRSGMPSGPYTMADLASDVVALVDHLGWERFRLVGMSFGGMVAQEVAVTVPHRIERLALLCTSPGGAGRSSYPLHTLTDLEPAERNRIYPTLLDTRFTPEWLATHDDDRALIDLLADRQDSEQSEAVREGVALQLRARSDHDVYDRLSRIHCPTLIAAGRSDGIAPSANSVAIADQIDGADLHLFDGGHLFLMQDPTALPVILDFLAGDDPTS
jgi:3-oxoadipate enol-lactonase